MTNFAYLVKAVLLLTFVMFNDCSIMLAPATINTAFPWSCWNKEAGQAVSVGRFWQVPGCARATCVEHRDNLFVELASCGTFHVPAGCRTVQDLDQPFPSCCPQLHCPHNGDTDALLGPEYAEFNNWVDTYYDDSNMV